MTIFAGFLSGIAGAMGLGGGSFLLLYLTLIMSVPQIKAQGINLLFFIPCAIVSIFLHNRNKLICWSIVLPVALGGILGIFCGLWLLSIINPNILNKIFGIFLILFGLAELFIKKR
ncbi:MAG: sulfite exporter TauE/SafE family protein [Clostridia bacterium]|nr:sulfite exporter TauE/SafE family protein [Clostridia bacterium]